MKGLLKNNSNNNNNKSIDMHVGALQYTHNTTKMEYATRSIHAKTLTAKLVGAGCPVNNYAPQCTRLRNIHEGDHVGSRYRKRSSAVCVCVCVCVCGWVWVCVCVCVGRRGFLRS